MIFLMFSDFNDSEIQDYLTIDKTVWLFHLKNFIRKITFLTNDIILGLRKYFISSSSDSTIKDPLFITFFGIANI